MFNSGHPFMFSFSKNAHVTFVTTIETNQFSERKLLRVPLWPVYRALPSINRGSHEITLTVPLIISLYFSPTGKLSPGVDESVVRRAHSFGSDDK